MKLVTRKDSETLELGVLGEAIPAIQSGTPYMAPVEFTITGVNQGTNTFTVAENVSAKWGVDNNKMGVIGSTGNDGVYTVVSATYDTDHTDIVVSESIPDTTVDGTLYLTKVLNSTEYAITAVNKTGKTFTIDGDHSSIAGYIGVLGSTGNDRVYTVVSATFDTNHTDIVVSEAIADATADGALRVVEDYVTFAHTTTNAGDIVCRGLAVKASLTCGDIVIGDISTDLGDDGFVGGILTATNIITGNVAGFFADSGSSITVAPGNLIAGNISVYFAFFSSVNVAGNITVGDCQSFCEVSTVTAGGNVTVGNAGYFLNYDGTINIGGTVTTGGLYDFVNGAYNSNVIIAGTVTTGGIANNFVSGGGFVMLMNAVLVDSVGNYVREGSVELDISGNTQVFGVGRSNIRSGVLNGTCAVPAAANVKKGVAVDNTVGTLPTDILGTGLM
jgi:hypothetical protein